MYSKNPGRPTHFCQPYLQGEDPRVRRRVQLDDGLHRQRAVDEVGRLVVHVLDPDDDALVVRV